jgi:E3 ubiquitin ligase EDD
MRAAPLRGTGRGTGGVIMASTGSRPVVPSTYVPEELVSQAQVVLQGKSRNLIIRELQVCWHSTILIIRVLHES